MAFTMFHCAHKFGFIPRFSSYVSLAYLLFFVLLCQADEHTHMYEDNEEVVVWYNTVGPYYNRQETYNFFTLPFCRGPRKEVSHYHETIAEALQGVELEFSGLDMEFKKNVPRSKYCEVQLTSENVEAFSYAVLNQYWYQVFIDELPVWSAVGIVSEDSNESPMVLTHKHFEIGYNGNQIVEVSLTSENKKPLVEGSILEFTYEVTWRPTTTKFSERFDKYLDSNFFQHRIHWFSIFNSFMMVLFLVGLVSMILMRTLRRDYARYNKDDEADIDDLERQLGDEYGWKQIHGDVFRPPAYRTIISAFLGVGSQLTVCAGLVICMTIFADLYEHQGSMLSAFIFLYAVTSPVAGYVGSASYRRFGGQQWIKQMLITALLLPSLISAVAFVVNIIAMYYHATKAIPFLTILAVLSICLFVIVPLTLMGAILGRNYSGAVNTPCRINPVPRAIPEKPWYMEPYSIIMFGGVLPFGSIFIEVYFIFTSFWAYKIYYVYGFMLLVFVMLLIVTSCVTVVCVYFLLNTEDYRWHWSSFLCGASVSYYIYLYAIYYFVFKTKMYGLFQTVFYFGYTAVLSSALGLMCGTFGYLSAELFVRKIYATVKID